MDFIKQRHVDAFDRANEMATAVDPSHGADFKAAFVAVLIVEAKVRNLRVHPTLDPDRPVETRRFNVPAGMLRADEAADYLGIPVQTLYGMRKNKRGPKTSQHGRMLCYALADLDEYKATLE